MIPSRPGPPLSGVMRAGATTGGPVPHGRGPARAGTMDTWRDMRFQSLSGRGTTGIGA